MLPKPTSSPNLDGIYMEDCSDNDSNCSLAIVVTDFEGDFDERLVEDSQEIELLIFEEIHIEGSDSSSSGFDLEGFVENGAHEISGPSSGSQLDKESNTENSGTVTKEIREEGDDGAKSSLTNFGVRSVLEVPSNSSSSENSNEVLCEGSPIGTASLSNAIKVEPILDDGASRNTMEESVGTNQSQSSAPDGAASMGLEAKTTVDGVKSCDLEASVHGMDSQTAVNGGEEISTAEYLLSFGAFLLPHPAKASAGGEDAYFIVGQNWFGVADGVGEWAERGINAGNYARELMENCRKIVSDINSTALTNPEVVLSRSALESQSPGSSTILVAYFDGQTLHVANVGDSGFIAIRNGGVYEKSTPRFFDFNCPYQIQHGDDPSELVERYRIDLKDGDLIVTATDGLFDNLYEQEIASIVSKSLESNLKPGEIAEVLAMRAQEVGGSETAQTPFGDAVKEAGYVGFTGGKLDDVAVIVSLVQKKTGP